MFAVHVASDPFSRDQLIRLEADDGTENWIYVSNETDETATLVVECRFMHPTLRDEYRANKSSGAWSDRTVAILDTNPHPPEDADPSNIVDCAGCGWPLDGNDDTASADVDSEYLTWHVQCPAPAQGV